MDYRLPEAGGTILVPSARLAELRLNMAAAGLPKTVRIGLELFDKTNLGATEFTEHVNYRRALEGELERSVMSLAEVEQARVHLTFPKDSVFLDAQQPAKASVLIRVRPGARVVPQNVMAINHLVASAVDGLSPDAVSVLDMNGNLLGRPKPPSSPDGPEASESLDYRHKMETDLLAKINSTLEPLLGANKYRAGVSVECDFNGGEQSEEVYDPTRSVMTSSQRTEDTTTPSSANGVPGTASTLPRPTSRPGGSSGHVSRVTENITYQSSRTVKKTRMPAGGLKKMSLAILVDQELTWERDKNGYRRVLVAPPADKLKIIRDLVAGVTGFSAERGDQILVETLPFENTLLLEPPSLTPPPGAPGKQDKQKPGLALQWDRKMQLIAGGVGAAVLALVIVLFRRGRGKNATATVTTQGALADAEGAPYGAPALQAGTNIEQQIESTLAERDAAQQKAEARVLNALKSPPAITKTAEVLAKHLREKIGREPEIAAQVLRTWIREEES